MGDDQLEQSPYELWEPRKTEHLDLNTMWQVTLSPSVIPNIPPKNQLHGTRWVFNIQARVWTKPPACQHSG